MSTQIFPSLLGLGWGCKRTPLWKTRVQEVVSGKETRVAYWSFPRWQWELTFDFLRQPSSAGSSDAEFAALAGFFNARQGQFDTFLYQDPDDNAVAGQGIAVGDGSTVSFPLVRAFGTVVEPILAPNIVSGVYVGGVPVPGSGFTVSRWGSASPGTITFTTAPASGAVVSADFSYYFPCRFTADDLTFEKFMAQLYSAKKVGFVS